ncbi:MAG: hypothetical protein ABI193_11690 [Minicystis sp.]
MTDHRSPPPPAETCLVRTYASRGMKGGTLIAEDVTDLATHEERLRTGGYRPACCPPCGGPLHIHDYRPRGLYGSGLDSAAVVRFRCADREECGAVFSVLPAFIARHLWRTWSTVEETTRGRDDGAEKAPLPVPARTAQRWRARLASAAMAVLVALVPSALGEALATMVGLGGTRAEVVAGYADLATPRPRRGLLLASLAGLVHRAAPGIRLV